MEKFTTLESTAIPLPIENIDTDQIIAAHAGLARHACGHEDNVRAGDVGVVVGALHVGVEAFRGAGFGDVECLALRDTFGNVEHDDVTEVLDGCEMGKRAADLACADEGNLGSGHENSSPSSVEVGPWGSDSERVAQARCGAAESPICGKFADAAR